MSHEKVAALRLTGATFISLRAPQCNTKAEVAQGKALADAAAAARVPHVVFASVARLDASEVVGPTFAPWTPGKHTGERRNSSGLSNTCDGSMAMETMPNQIGVGNIAIAYVGTRMRYCERRDYLIRAMGPWRWRQMPIFQIGVGNIAIAYGTSCQQCPTFFLHLHGVCFVFQAYGEISLKKKSSSLI